MKGVPEFEAFYKAVNRGRSPFPWQSRLARQVEDTGWPSLVSVPTGCGKTSCIDIAVWALARQAGRDARDRTAPTRLWYVVNRRLLVDRAFEHGCRLGELLAEPAKVQGEWAGASATNVAAVASVGTALRAMPALGIESEVLRVVRLRGGTELGARPPDPSQPAIVFSTVPMFASRWLFRGYGTSTSMRAIDAAHAGIDCLVLLDEAHLARPLLRMADQIAASDLGDPTSVIPSERARPTLVSLTATGDETGSRFELDDADRDHPVIRRRLSASKPTELVECVENDLARTLAAKVTDLCQEAAGSPRAVVFCNTPRTAREVVDHLGTSGADVVLLTGRMREWEAEAAKARIQDPLRGAPSGARPRDDSLAPLVVVATQTLEVGADLDFDILVTENAGVRALAQRFGRLNRLGDITDARAAIVHATDRSRGRQEKKSYPVYRAEPFDVWDRLIGAEADHGAIDLSPETINNTLGQPLDRPDRTGELLPAHLWEYAKTNPAPPGEAPPEAFFDSVEASDDIAVSVAWRAHVPAPGVRLTPPVREDESVDVPLGELRETFTAQGLEAVFRLTPDRASLEEVAVAALRPGDEIILRTSDGFYDVDGWNPAAREEVLDVSLLRRGSGLLWLEESAVLALTNRSAVPAVAAGGLKSALALLQPDDDDQPPDDETIRDVISEVKAILRNLAPHPWLTAQQWGAYLDDLADVCEQPVEDTAFAYVPLPRPWLSAAARVSVRTEAFDELSFTAKSALLAEHVGSVGEAAERIAQKLGLNDDAVRAVAAAGRYHDLGKAEPRFQAWLDPARSAGGPVAKSGAGTGSWERNRTASGWPLGGRHELLSARLLAEAVSSGVDISDLVLHLVSSHHGHGRPLVPVVDDIPATKVGGKVAGVDVVVSGDLSVPDWDQPRRFRMACEEYGLWGVALLEAIVRQADHAVSAIVEVI